MMRLLLLAFLLVGCGTVNTHRLMTGEPRAATQHEILIATDEDPLPPSFTEIALLSANGYGMLSTEADVLDALRADAAGLGADAIVRLHFDRGGNAVFGTGVAVLLNGGPVRGSGNAPPSTGSTPAPPTGTVPVVPSGYGSEPAPPADPNAIPPPPSEGAAP